MKDYFIRVYNDCEEAEDSFNEYDICTDKGPEMARLFAFLMDGGGGTEYHDDEGMRALAITYTEIVSVTDV